MARLAFIAIVMAALAPSISRWVAANATDAWPGLASMCTTSGLTLFDSAVSLDGDEAPRGSGAMDACDYCPLLAGAALLLLVLTLLFPAELAGAVPVFQPGSNRPSSIFPGLQSRGPPIAL